MVLRLFLATFAESLVTRKDFNTHVCCLLFDLFVMSKGLTLSCWSRHNCEFSINHKMIRGTNDPVPQFVVLGDTHPLSGMSFRLPMLQCLYINIMDGKIVLSPVECPTFMLCVSRISSLWKYGIAFGNTMVHTGVQVMRKNSVLPLPRSAHDLQLIDGDVVAVGGGLLLRFEDAEIKEEWHDLFDGVAYDMTHSVASGFNIQRTCIFLELYPCTKEYPGSDDSLLTQCATVMLVMPPSQLVFGYHPRCHIGLPYGFGKFHGIFCFNGMMLCLIDVVMSGIFVNGKPITIDSGRVSLYNESKVEFVCSSKRSIYETCDATLLKPQMHQQLTDFHMLQPCGLVALIHVVQVASPPLCGFSQPSISCNVVEFLSPALPALEDCGHIVSFGPYNSQWFANCFELSEAQMDMFFKFCKKKKKNITNSYQYLKTPNFNRSDDDGCLTLALRTVLSQAISEIEQATNCKIPINFRFNGPFQLNGSLGLRRRFYCGQSGCKCTGQINLVNYSVGSIVFKTNMCTHIAGNISGKVSGVQMVALKEQLEHHTPREVFQRSLHQFPMNGDCLLDPIRPVSQYSVTKIKSQQQTSVKWPKEVISAIMSTKSEIEDELGRRLQGNKEVYGILLDKFR
jgi:hypothetical protein